MLRVVWFVLGLALLGAGLRLFFYGIPAPTQLIEKMIPHEKFTPSN